MKSNLKKEDAKSNSSKKAPGDGKKETATDNKHEKGSNEQVSKHPTKEVNAEG